MTVNHSSMFRRRPHRTILKGLALAAALMATKLLAVESAHAGTSQQRFQAPGFYRMMLGDFEITALSDGTVPQPMDKLLLNIQAGDVEALVARAHQTLPLETSINAYLINTGKRLLLVDTGSGALFGAHAGGRLISSLKAAGYTPAQIDDVLLTHLHADHSGGLAVNGKRIFPNAVVHVSKADRDFRFDSTEEAKAPPAQRPTFQQSRASLEPYVRVGKVSTFEGRAQIVPGITTIAAPGHTPGHTYFLVESKNQKLLLWGDVVHAAEVQLARPGVAIQYDDDAAAAAQQRTRLLAELAEEGTLIGAAHISFPGLGYLHREEGGYSWMPVTYSLRGLAEKN